MYESVKYSVQVGIFMKGIVLYGMLHM